MIKQLQFIPALLFILIYSCQPLGAQETGTNPADAHNPLLRKTTRSAPSTGTEFFNSCGNLDFTSGTTGWTGRWCNTPNALNYNTPAPSLPAAGLNGSGGVNAFGYMHELVTFGQDPHAPISRVPPGHTSALRLGDDKAFKVPVTTTPPPAYPFNHQMIRNTFLVTAANPGITYWYAVVFDQDMKQAHTETDQPYFRIRLYDQLGIEIKCASYDVNATKGPKDGFQTAPMDINTESVYKDWVPIYIPLINYVGQQMTIQFESSDCSKGGHFGYAYIAVDCNPFAVITSTPFLCGTKTVTLTAPDGASTYLWTGPGVIPPNNTKSVTVDKPGKYHVTMTVKGNSGAICTYDIDTVIQGSSNSPTALYSNTTVCVGNPTKFTDGSTPVGAITSWSWDFNNDGVEDSNVQNPTYTFSAAGTYQVKLTVKQGPCDATIIKTVTVDPGPVLVITNPPPVCAPETVDITLAAVTAGSIGGGTLSYWMDNAATTAVANPKAIAEPGTYYIKVSGNGCSDIKPVVVTFNSLAHLIITDPAPVCAPATVDITDPAVTAGSTGNGALTYWSDPAFTIPLSNPSAVSTGTYYIKSTPAGGAGCAAIASVKVTVNAVPTVNAGSVKAVCPGNSIQLNGFFGGSATSATWSGGAGTFADKNNPVTTYTPTPAEFALGTLTLTLTTNDPDGPCTPASSDVIVILYQNPVIHFLADKKKGCPVHCVNFSDSSFVVGGKPAQWKWNFGDAASSTNTSDLPNPKHCYENTGFYDVSLTVTSDQGCVSSLAIMKMIQVFAIPIAEFTPTPVPASMYDPKVTLKNGSSPDVVYWNYHFGDGDSVSPKVKSPVHMYPGIASSTYMATLHVRNADGCVNRVEHLIEIGPEFTFYIPNAFTPIRNDGVNDTFFGKGIGIVEYHIWIFDRWGNMVFDTPDINHGWDGRANKGEDVAQQDVFVWKVKLKDIFGKWHDYIGTVTLVK
jgi:gliding motility-associated-like protein